MFLAPAGITSQLFPFVPVAQDHGEWGPCGCPISQAVLREGRSCCAGGSCLDVGELEGLRQPLRRGAQGCHPIAHSDVILTSKAIHAW